MIADKLIEATNCGVEDEIKVVREFVDSQFSIFKDERLIGVVESLDKIIEVTNKTGYGIRDDIYDCLV